MKIEEEVRIENYREMSLIPTLYKMYVYSSAGEQVKGGNKREEVLQNQTEFKKGFIDIKQHIYNKLSK